MICPKCGRQIPDGTVCPCMGGAPTLSSNPALNVLKTVGSSPLFLVAAILYSATALISLITQLQGTSFNALAYSMVDNFGVDPMTMYDVMNYFNASSLISALFTFLPCCLIAVGMWLHFATCRSTADGGISTTGLSLCKVGVIIGLVFICAAAVLILAACILLFAGAGAYFSYGGYGSEADIAAALGVGIVVIFITLVPILVLMICYYVSQIRAIGRLKATAVSGIPDNRISRFLTGMNYVLGVLSALGGLTLLFSSPLAGLVSFASAACAIIMAVALGKYRQQMTLLMYPPVQPVYAQPAAPAAPVAPAVPVAPVTPAAPAAPTAPVAPSTPAAEPVTTAEPEAPAEEKPQE